MKKIFAFTKSYLHLHKWPLALYITITIVVSTSALISPYIIGDFIDQLMTAGSMTFIYRYFALFAAINLTTLLLGYISGQLYIHLQTTMGFALNRDFIKKLQYAPINFTNKQDTAYLNQRINNDTNALIIFSVGIIQSVLINMVIIGVTSAIMFTFHPLLAGVLIGVAVVYFTFYALYKKVLYKASHTFQESQSSFFSKLNEQLFNIRFIKLHSLFSHFIGRLDNSFGGLLRDALTYQRARYIFGGLDKIVMIVAQMILLLFGGREIIAGRLTIGRFIIISSYFNMMLGSIRYFFGLGQTVQQNMVSYNRLQEFAAVAPEPNGASQLDGAQTIELANVSFTYGENAVLKNISQKFSKGHIYVLLGPNGAGKSTLADILMGLQNGNYSGDVLYNGVDMGEIDMYTLRNTHFGISEQEPILVADTLAYNLSLGQADFAEIDRAELDKFIGILGLGAYIQTLPNQFEATINESAANVSGGEKQKISILRALIKNPDVLVLDEPTSALDMGSKVALRGYLDEIKADKIVIVVTHDKDFVDYETDVLILLDKPC